MLRNLTVTGFYHIVKKPVWNLVSLVLILPVTKNTVRQGSSHVHSFWTSSISDDVKCDCSLSLLKLRKLDDAIDDCTNAVKLDDTYIKAYLRRAQW